MSIIRAEFKNKKLSYYESRSVLDKKLEKDILENKDLIDLFSQIEKYVEESIFGEDFEAALVRPFLYKTSHIYINNKNGESNSKLYFDPEYRKFSLPGKTQSEIVLDNDKYKELKDLISKYENIKNSIKARVNTNLNNIEGVTYKKLYDSNKELFGYLLERLSLEYDDIFVSTKEQKNIDDLSKFNLESLNNRLKERD